MKQLARVIRFIKPYRTQAILSMLLLVGVVVADLLIPRLTQRVIDQGIAMQDMRTVATTSLLMLTSALFMVIADTCCPNLTTIPLT